MNKVQYPCVETRQCLVSTSNQVETPKLGVSTPTAQNQKRTKINRHVIKNINHKKLLSPKHSFDFENGHVETRHALSLLSLPNQVETPKLGVSTPLHKQECIMSFAKVKLL